MATRQGRKRANYDSGRPKSGRQHRRQSPTRSHNITPLRHSARLKTRTQPHRATKSYTCQQDPQAASPSPDRTDEVLHHDERPEGGDAPSGVLETTPFDFLPAPSVPDASNGLENIDEDAQVEQEGYLCELHSYDARYNSRGERLVMQTGSSRYIDLGTNRSSEAALKLTRIYSWDKGLESTQLEIQSPHIKLALREVIKSYPGVNINTTGSITIVNEPRCLFHYRESLHNYAEESSVPDVYRHITFCLQYMYKTLKTEILAFENSMQDSTACPGLEFEHLWMAFRPGEMLCARLNGREVLATLVDLDKVFRGTGSSKQLHEWCVIFQVIRYNGSRFGLTNEAIHIEKYSGHRPLAELPAFPLVYHGDGAQLSKLALERGKKYTQLRGVHYYAYQGRSALRPRETPHSDAEGERSTVQNINHRVIIDAAEFYTNVDRSASASNESLPKNIGTEDGPDFTDQQYMICWPDMPGYSLQSKQWGLFDVSNLSELSLDKNAYESLVLPSDKKEMLQSLIQQRELGTGSFDDLIEGKGKGLILLLHGPPGVGKTFTAESIAEYSQRPLYSLNCGELGTQSHSLERSLSRILHLAGRWNAIVLMDEADVFMMERRPYDIERNSMVAVLLRTLEYFEGVLILTTNKLSAIDSAFMSRVHLSIAYPILCIESHQKLWRTFAMKAAGVEQPPSWLDAGFLDRAAAFEINGREIKNAARVAHALAMSAGRPLVSQDIFDVLEAVNSFGASLQASETKDDGESQEHTRSRRSFFRLWKSD